MCAQRGEKGGHMCAQQGEKGGHMCAQRGEKGGHMCAQQGEKGGSHVCTARAGQHTAYRGADQVRILSSCQL